MQALADVYDEHGGDGAKTLLARLQHELSQKGVVLTDAALNTPYKNTIPLADQPPYPRCSAPSTSPPASNSTTSSWR